MSATEKNPFKLLHPEQEVPSDIKDKLMNDITLLHLLTDITDLFSGKMGKTAIELLNPTKEK